MFSDINLYLPCTKYLKRHETFSLLSIRPAYCMDATLFQKPNVKDNTLKLYNWP